MRRIFAAAIALLFAGVLCLTLPLSSRAYWQSVLQISIGSSTPNVALNACGSANTNNNAVTTKDFNNLTIVSGTNKALVVPLNFSAIVTGVSVTWDQGGANQSLSRIVTVDQVTSTQADLWGLVVAADGIVTGNKTLRVSWTGSSQLVMDACAYNNVDQTGGSTSFPNSTTAAAAVCSGTATKSVTSAIGNMVFGTWDSAGNPTAVSGTQVYLDTSGAVISAAAHYDAGASSVNMVLTTPTAICLGVFTDIKKA